MSNYNTLKTADTINAISIVDGAITTSKLNASVTTLIVSGSGPKVAAITYPGNDLAADPAGGQTITLTGTGFVSGCSVFVGTTQASVVTVVSATSVTFTAPALAAATYTLYLVNPDGGTATIVPGISYSGTPIWSTTAGTLGSVYEYSPISNATTATGDGSISYSVFSGTLPTGSSLNTSTGVITGTSPASAGATTYTFVIRATDAQLQDSDRSFSITVNTDTVTWTSPAAASTVSLNKDLASTTALLATSAAGKAITYTANTLPTGMSISGATVTGTPTVVGNTTSTFTATAATTNRTATAIINWTVSVAADTYFPYTTLLLSGAAATETFVADASANNFALAISGDTKPNNFNPYTPGYYSNYFDGTGDYLSLASNSAFAFSTGDYTFECWINSSTTAQQVVFTSGGTGTNNFNFSFAPASGYIGVGTQAAWVLQATSLTLSIGVWYHVAASRSSGTLKLFLNGAQVASGADSTTWIQGGSLAIGNNAASGQYTHGYISNLRVVNGVAVYTGTFTPPTAPLTATQSSGTNISAITGTATSLLTCQSNRFIDNSTNLFAITVYGDTTVSPVTPFVPNTQYAAYGSTYFDGTGDYLRVPYNAGFAMGSSNFTIEYWVYPTVLTGDITVLGAHTSDANGGYGVGFYGTTPRTWINFGSGWPQVTGPSALLNAWNHIALVRNGSSFYMYTNGVPGTVYTNAAAIVNASNSDVTIGARYNGTANFYTGYVTDARIIKGTAVYTSAFTPPSAPLTAITNTSLLTLQTNQPVNNSVFLDSSTNAFAVTRTGNTSAGTFTPYGANWSNYFDGTGDKLTLPSSSAFDLSDSTWTIEFWMYSLATPPGGNDCRLLMAGANGGAASWDVQYNNNASIGFFRPYAGSPTAIYSSAGTIALNTWYHIAVVCNAGSARLYINGVLVAGPVTISLPTSAAQGLRIGYDDPGTVNFQYNGYLSNVRIVKGVAVYTSAFTPSTTPLTATQSSGTNISAITGTATSLLTCQSNRFVDNSTNAFVVTITGDVAVQRFSPVSPSAAYTASTTGGSAYFDGTGDYLTVPSNARFQFGTGDFTIECWFYDTGTSDSYSSLISSLNSWQTGSTALRFNNLASRRFAFMHNPTGDPVFSSTNTFNSYQWCHVVVARSGTSLKMFVNGVQEASATMSVSISLDTTTGVLIGSGWDASSKIKGYVNDVRVVKGVAVYTSAFTPPSAPLTAITNTSLLLNMTSAGVYDSTMINDLETVGDAKILSTQTPYAGSYYSNYFDGTGDYLSVPATAQFAFSTGNFTIEAWVYLTAYGSSIVGPQIFGTVNGTSNGYSINVGQNIDTFRIISNATGSWADNLVVASGGGLPLNAWTHMCVVRSGANLTIYKNGVSVASTESATTWNFSGTTGIIGRFNEGTYTRDFAGYVSNLRVVNGTAVYTGTFTPPTVPLTAITGTSLLTCQSNSFIDNSTNAFAVTRAGDTSVQSFNPFRRNSATAMSFDGTGDVLSIAASQNFVFTGNFTVEGWVYIDSTMTSTRPDNLKTFIFMCWNTGNTPQLYVYGNTSTPGIGLGYYDSNSSWDVAVTIPKDQWVHIAYVRTGTILYGFVAGTRYTINASISATIGTNNTMVIAGNPNQVSAYYSYLKGYINDLRITKGTARYTATFTPPTTAFITR